jgi:hypothetical protein
MASPFDDSITPSRALLQTAESIAAAEDTDSGADGGPLPPVGRGYAFDFTDRRFVRSPARGVQQIRGDAQLRSRIIKALLTQRGGASIHQNSYGLESLEDLIGSTAQISTADLARLLSEALSIDDRVLGISDLDVLFDDGSETVQTSFTVNTDSGLLRVDL